MGAKGLIGSDFVNFDRSFFSKIITIISKFVIRIFFNLSHIFLEKCSVMGEFVKILIKNFWVNFKILILALLLLLFNNHVIDPCFPLLVNKNRRFEFIVRF